MDRVIALSPAITELIYALKLEAHLVGVSEYSDFPEAAKSIERVGPYTKPFIEKILKLKPKLVFIPDEGPRDILENFDRLQIPYAIVRMRRLKDIDVAASQIAKALGAKSKGEEFSKNWNKEISLAFSKSRLKEMSAIIEIQSEPLIVAAKNTFLDDILEGCGGKNGLASQSGYPKISREIQSTSKADIIFLTEHFNSKKDQNRAVEMWRTFPNFKETRILRLDPDSTSRPGPRLISAAQDICQLREHP